MSHGGRVIKLEDSIEKKASGFKNLRPKKLYNPS